MKKFTFKKMVTLMMAVLTMTICFSFSTVSAAAAEPAVAVAISADDSVIAANTTAMSNMISHKIVQMAGTAPAAGGGSVTNTKADTTYKSVVDFIIKWLQRVGWLVAFVGAIMFALAIKNNDADQKQNGLLTMVSGFVVAAICLASSMFNLFA